MYDTSTNAGVTLQDDRIAGDVLTLSNTSASFADKNAGSNKVVTVNGIAAGGADAGNYALAATTATTKASITQATLQVTGVSAQNRSYDTSRNAALTGTAVVTALGSDVVNVTGTGTGIGQFADKNIADAATQVPPLGDLPGAGAGTGAGLSSTAPAATPAANSATPPAKADTAGITVALVRPASQQQSGAIAVSVPKQIVDAGNSFGFPLPAQVIETAAVNRVPVQAQLADGSALPSWISYNADSKSFVVQQVPNGALPLEIVLVIGSQRATMVVAER